MHSLSFKHPPLDLKLTSDEIHVWLGVLDQPESEFQRYMQTLSIDERVRADRFIFQEDRKRFIFRHGMIRMILGRYLGVEASELRLYQGKNGKPDINKSSCKGSIHFNLSHSDGIALFALNRNNEIGVDIERLRDIPEMDQIVERFFCERERFYFRSLPQDKRRDAFFYYWTCKEAFIKAIGEGLSCPLDKFDVTLALGEKDMPRTIKGDSRGVNDWSIYTLKPTREFVGALAIKSNSYTLKCFKWMAAGTD